MAVSKTSDTGVTETGILKKIIWDMRSAGWRDPFCGFLFAACESILQKLVIDRDVHSKYTVTIDEGSQEVGYCKDQGKVQR